MKYIKVGLWTLALLANSLAWANQEFNIRFSWQPTREIPLDVIYATATIDLLPDHRIRFHLKHPLLYTTQVNGEEIAHFRRSFTAQVEANGYELLRLLKEHPRDVLFIDPAEEHISIEDVIKNIEDPQFRHHWSRNWGILPRVLMFDGDLEISGLIVGEDPHEPKIGLHPSLRRVFEIKANGQPVPNRSPHYFFLEQFHLFPRKHTSDELIRTYLKALRRLRTPEDTSTRPRVVERQSNVLKVDFRNSCENLLKQDEIVQ